MDSRYPGNSVGNCSSLSPLSPSSLLEKGNAEGWIPAHHALGVTSGMTAASDCGSCFLRVPASPPALSPAQGGIEGCLRSRNHRFYRNRAFPRVSSLSSVSSVSSVVKNTAFTGTVLPGIAAATEGPGPRNDRREWIPGLRYAPPGMTIFLNPFPDFLCVLCGSVVKITAFKGTAPYPRT